jgi:hypothetical protein
MIMSSLQLRSFLVLACLIHLPGCKGCETGWKKLKGKCFYFGQESLPYLNASEACVEKRGILFEPKNEQANEYIAQLAPKESYLNSTQPTYWIGIVDLLQEGHFVFESSGSQIKYENWAFDSDSDVDEPDNDMDSQDCGVVVNTDGDWHDEDCAATSHQFVCEDLQQDLDYWSSCPSGWNLINKKCYKLIDQTVKFDAALEMCMAIGGKLFEPTYEKEESLVRAHYYGTDNVDALWIGITDRGHEGSFKYASTDAPVEYTNWAKNSLTDEPDNKENQDCTVLSGGAWSEVDCDCGNVARPVCQQGEPESCP